MFYFFPIRDWFVQGKMFVNDSVAFWYFMILIAAPTEIDSDLSDIIVESELLTPLFYFYISLSFAIIS